MNIHVICLDHVQICIPDGEEEKARRFYTDILGFREIEKPDSLKKNGGLWYEVGDTQLHIGTEIVQNNQSKRHPAFEITNLRETKHYLMKQGVKIKEEIPIPGINRFSFFDPFDNRIELLERDRD